MAKKRIRNEKFEQIQTFSESNKEGLTFSAMCKFIRETFQITQPDIARKLKVGVNTYQYWEYGKQEPSSKLAIDLYLLFLEAKKQADERNTSENQFQETSKKVLAKIP
jgi:DNA-binding transcriptional regulator YiaG